MLAHGLERSDRLSCATCDLIAPRSERDAPEVPSARRSGSQAVMFCRRALAPSPTESSEMLASIWRVQAASRRISSP
jgi:hypothetical protein